MCTVTVKPTINTPAQTFAIFWLTRSGLALGTGGLAARRWQSRRGAVPGLGLRVCSPSGRFGDTRTAAPSARAVLGSGHVALELPRERWARTLFSEGGWVVQMCCNVTSGDLSAAAACFPSFIPKTEKNHENFKPTLLLIKMEMGSCVS